MTDNLVSWPHLRAKYFLLVFSCGFLFVYGPFFFFLNASYIINPSFIVPLDRRAKRLKDFQDLDHGVVILFVLKHRRPRQVLTKSWFLFQTLPRKWSEKDLLDFVLSICLIVLDHLWNGWGHKTIEPLIAGCCCFLLRISRALDSSLVARTLQSMSTYIYA